MLKKECVGVSFQRGPDFMKAIAAASRLYGLAAHGYGSFTRLPHERVAGCVFEQGAGGQVTMLTVRSTGTASGHGAKVRSRTDPGVHGARYFARRSRIACLLKSAAALITAR